MRRYNSWWSRFLQPDPYDGSYNLTDPQSLNRYSYVQNDPVNYVDPSGLNLSGILSWLNRCWEGYGNCSPGFYGYSAEYGWTSGDIGSGSTFGGRPEPGDSLDPIERPQKSSSNPANNQNAEERKKKLEECRGEASRIRKEETAKIMYKPQDLLPTTEDLGVELMTGGGSAVYKIHHGAKLGAVGMAGLRGIAVGVAGTIAYKFFRNGLHNALENDRLINEQYARYKECNRLYGSA